MVSIPNTFLSGSVIRSADVNTNFTTVAAAILPTFTFTVVGTLVTGTNVTPALIVHNTLTISKAYAYIKTIPTGQDVIIDILKNGISIWSSTPANRLTIGAGAQTGSQTSFDTTSLVEGDILTLSIIQVGSTVAGESLTVELKCT